MIGVSSVARRQHLMPKPLLATAEQEPVSAPYHVAIIMDGNRRWAKRRRLPSAAGHRAGANNVRPVAEACADYGVRCLTLFAFSTENWERPRSEVNLLLDLMQGMLNRDLNELNKRDVRLNFIGDGSRFPEDLHRQMKRAGAMTRNNKQMKLNIAANYGGRWDITEASRSMARAVASGRLDPEDIDEETVAFHLSLNGLPSPDLCIRTGGEQRISNFLLWDFAYTELYFTETFWPDFNEACLLDAFGVFDDRERRFGRQG